MRDETTAAQRARSDAAELTEDLKTLSGRGLLIVSFYRQIAEQLVTWGWTKIRVGEQVVNKPRPGAGNLQEQLAADIVARGDVPAEPDALATYLVDGGWTKLEPGERVIGPADAALLNEVQCAYVRWEALKKKFKENQGESGEVSADASELTSGVKLTTPATRILAVFRSATGPLFASEAIDMANGEHVDSMGPLDTTWHYWRDAFSALVEMKLLEPAYEPVREGMERRYQLTAAGRAWNDGTTL